MEREVIDVEWSGLEELVWRFIEATLNKIKFKFNLLVVGERCSGKSSLLERLLKRSMSSWNSWEEEGIRVRWACFAVDGAEVELSVSETVGFGESIDGNKCVGNVVGFVADQMEKYLERQVWSDQSTPEDNRIHLCLYLISPSSRGLRPLDIFLLQSLCPFVNIIPILAKIDWFTAPELANFKTAIVTDLQTNNITYFAGPFQVITGYKPRRDYAYGSLEVDQYSEISSLKTLIFKSKTFELIWSTQVNFYENYKKHRLASLWLQNRKPFTDFLRNRRADCSLQISKEDKDFVYEVPKPEPKDENPVEILENKSFGSTESLRTKVAKLEVGLEHTVGAWARNVPKDIPEQEEKSGNLKKEPKQSNFTSFVTKFRNWGLQMKPKRVNSRREIKSEEMELDQERMCGGPSLTTKVQRNSSPPQGLDRMMVSTGMPYVVDTEEKSGKNLNKTRIVSGSTPLKDNETMKTLPDKPVKRFKIDLRSIGRRRSKESRNTQTDSILGEMKDETPQMDLGNGDSRDSKKKQYGFIELQKLDKTQEEDARTLGIERLGTLKKDFLERAANVGVNLFQGESSGFYWEEEDQFWNSKKTTKEHAASPEMNPNKRYSSLDENEDPDKFNVSEWIEKTQVEPSRSVTEKQEASLQQPLKHLTKRASRVGVNLNQDEFSVFEVLKKMNMSSGSVTEQQRTALPTNLKKRVSRVDVDLHEDKFSLLPQQGKRYVESGGAQRVDHETEIQKGLERWTAQIGIDLHPHGSSRDQELMKAQLESDCQLTVQRDGVSQVLREKQAAKVGTYVSRGEKCVLQKRENIQEESIEAQKEEPEGPIKWFSTKRDPEIRVKIEQNRFREFQPKEETMVEPGGTVPEKIETELQTELDRRADLETLDLEPVKIQTGAKPLTAEQNKVDNLCFEPDTSYPIHIDKQELKKLIDFDKETKLVSNENLDHGEFCDAQELKKIFTVEEDGLREEREAAIEPLGLVATLYTGPLETQTEFRAVPTKWEEADQSDLKGSLLDWWDKELNEEQEAIMLVQPEELAGSFTSRTEVQEQEGNWAEATLLSEDEEEATMAGSELINTPEMEDWQASLELENWQVPLDMALGKGSDSLLSVLTEDGVGEESAEDLQASTLESGLDQICDLPHDLPHDLPL